MILRYTLFIFILFLSTVSALSLTSHDNYKLYISDKYTIIYTDTYKEEAKFLKTNLDNFLKYNDKSFGYSFDEPLIISLISPNIQIANAFSTQYPYNLTTFYSGGVQQIDYFNTTSWLNALISHEITHNYQLNAKSSSVSKKLHQYLGNNPIPLFVPIPLFTLPNLLLPTALLEGNSVLNESRYNNGGRLYSGRFKALANSLILANKITPTTFINDHLNFPYTEEKYIVGGFFMKYLADKYGIDKVNSFFLKHSEHFINPLRINNTFLNHFGSSFEKLVNEFVAHTKKTAKDFKKTNSNDNKTIAKSKSYIYLNKINDEILFLTSNLTTSPTLNIYNIKTNSIKTKNGSWLNGKIFKSNNKYFTNGSNYISPTLYKIGLFDSNRIIKQDTISKSIQDYHEDLILYFDVNSSFMEPKLFLNNEFYDTAHSSALFDSQGNIFYFKQSNNKRTLYKNKKAVFSFDGHYSKLAEIDKTGDIYFIASTKLGSSFYKYSKNSFYKLSEADNIINAKLIDENNAIVISIDENGYNAQILPLNKIKSSIYETKKLRFKNNTNHIFNEESENINTNYSYNELKQLHFSNLYPYYSSDNGNDTFMINALFIDPLMFNMINLYWYKDSELSGTGISYTNERYIPFSLLLYDTSREVKSYNDRGFGGEFKVYGPLLKKGMHTLEVELKHYLDDQNRDKNPTILSLNHLYLENYPLGFEPYFKSDFTLYAKSDRSDSIYGFDYNFNHHIFNELYFDLEAKGSYSNTSRLTNNRGIKIIKKEIEEFKDKSDFYIEGVDNEFYVKQIEKASIGVSKSFHISKYFFTFPISLRRESLFLKYSYFEMDRLRAKKENFNEKIAGIKFDLLFLNMIPIPVTVKYIENSYSKEKYKVKVTIGISF